MTLIKKILKKVQNKKPLNITQNWVSYKLICCNDAKGEQSSFGLTEKDVEWRLVSWQTKICNS